MDNRYYSYGCPALMSDGRFLTSYVDSDIYNQYIRNINNIKTSCQYRHFLQNHGDDILNKEREYLIRNNTCSVYGNCVPIGTCQSKPLKKKVNKCKRNN